MSKAFIIIDPSLRDLVGHHYPYDQAVATAAAAGGFRSFVLGHRDVLPEITRSLSVVPAFRRDMWSGHPLAARLRASGGRLARLADRLDDPLCARDFAADLASALKTTGYESGSVLFAHMVLPKQLAGFAQALRRSGRRDVTSVLLLRYVRAFYDTPYGARAFRELEALVAKGFAIRLASDSARLAEHIGNLTTLPFEVLPIPHTPPEFGPPPARAATRFVQLGNAREEKGYREILAAIRILQEAPEGLDGLEFVLQSNAPYPPEMQAEIADFSRRMPPGVRLITQALDEESYAAELRDADVVLAPYHRDVYEGRTSGVLIEAITAGRPVIATAETWMNDELAQHGAGLLIPDRDATALAAAIRRAAAGRQALAAQAMADRSAARARHSADALVRQCAGEAPDPVPRKPRHIVAFYPFADVLDRSSGASQRFNLMLDVLAPRVDSIRVLQAGSTPTTQQGNVTIESTPERIRHRWLRRAVNWITLPLLFGAGNRRDQAWVLYAHLERMFDRAFARRVQALVAQADAVLVEYTFWSPTVVAACRAAGRPCVLTQYDVMSNQITRSRGLRWLVRRIELARLRAADPRVSASFSDQAMFRRFGVETRVLPNPADADRLTMPLPAAARTMVEGMCGESLPDKPIALFVGSRFTPNLVAVDRLRQIAAQCPDWSFVLAGTCAPRGRSGNVIALGKVPEAALIALYRAAAVPVIPLSYGTGSSLKTVEALATGRPVLGTSAAFRGLQVDPAADCFLEDDLARWPAILSSILANPSHADAVGVSGRRFVTAYEHRHAFAAYGELLHLPPPANTLGEEMAFRAWIFALDCLQESLDRGAYALAEAILAQLPQTAPALPAGRFVPRDHLALLEDCARKGIDIGANGLARLALTRLVEARQAELPQGPAQSLDLRGGEEAAYEAPGESATRQMIVRAIEGLLGEFPMPAGPMAEQAIGLRNLFRSAVSLGRPDVAREILRFLPSSGQQPKRSDQENRWLDLAATVLASGDVTLAAGLLAEGRHAPARISLVDAHAGQQR